MKKVIIRSLCIAIVLTIARTIYFATHPEWSAPLWIPALSAFIGGFIAAIVVLGTIEVIERKRDKK